MVSGGLRTLADGGMPRGARRVPGRQVRSLRVVLDRVRIVASRVPYRSVRGESPGGGWSDADV